MGKWCLHASLFIFDQVIIKVTRTGIKAQLSSILGRIRPLILELLALVWRKFHTFELEYLWSQLANLDQILFIASLGWGKGCVRFWGRLDQNSGFHGNRKPPLTYNGENDVFTFSAGNQDRHKSLDEFNFRPLVSMAHLYVFWNEIWPWHIGLRWAIVAFWATCFYSCHSFTVIPSKPLYIHYPCLALW